MSLLPPPTDAENALVFLGEFDVETIRRGESYVRQARVLRVECIEPAFRYQARVLGGSLYEVNLSFGSRNKGWHGHCSCPMAGGRCKHVYATLRHLLNITGTKQTTIPASSLRGAPERAGNANIPGTSPASGPIDATSPPLTILLRNALGRPLLATEVGYLYKVRNVYHRYRSYRGLAAWDLKQLNLEVVGIDSGPFRLWVDEPADEVEFWLYLAAGVRRAGGRVPAMMEPISDTSLIDGRLAELERKGEVQKWQAMLGQLTTSSWTGVTDPIASAIPLDLRLQIDRNGITVETSEPPHTLFKPLNDRKLEKFAERLAAGEVVLLEVAAALWTLISPRVNQYAALRPLGLHDPGNRQWLGRILRQPGFADRIITAQGVPLIRPVELLAWSLNPVTPHSPDRPSPGDTDYQLRLSLPDGSTPQNFYAVLEGRPYLYLTDTTVFSGPKWPTGVLPFASQHRIPDAALESPAGLQLLNRLGVPLPEKLAAKVKTVPLEISIHCELLPINATSSTEDCVITIHAKAKDHSIHELFDGRRWVDAHHQNPWSVPKPATLSATAVKGGEILIHDRTLQDQVPSWLAPLETKADEFGRQLRLRVNKAFPEKFASWIAGLPPEANINLSGDLASLVRDPVSGSVRLEATETTIDWFDLKVVLDVSDTSLSTTEIQLLLAAKGGFVRIKGKGWHRLKFNLTEEDDSQLARLGVSPHELSDETQRFHALQLADDAAQRFLPPEQAQAVVRRAAELKTRVTPEIPTGVKAELRTYQRDGFHFLAYLATNNFGGILADDMGLGKTLQTLTWLSWLRSEASGHAPGPALVVCPKSVMDNWRSETERFTPDLRVRVWTAAEAALLPERVGEADIHVINYAQLRLIGDRFARIDWLVVILDEGQNIKNPSSQTAIVACALRARFRLILSGTPIENKLLDLWSLLAFAMPGVLGSRTRFNQIYDAKNDPLARRRLSARVRPFLLRRTKSQVAKELPPRIEEDLLCELEGDQEKLYRAELKRAQQILLKIATDKQLAKERFHLLTSLLRLRQICCHPALLLGDEAFKATHLANSDPIETSESKPGKKNRKEIIKNVVSANSAKLEALLETLEPIMEEGAKVLVFSQFLGLIELLKRPLKERGWPLYELTGATEHRGELVQKFQAHEGPAVFLISLKAGGAGLNLTAATYVVLFDPWWNPAVENQAIDRTHRIGQTQQVVAYRLLMKNTIEEKIRALQKSKGALAEDVLGEEKFSQSLTLNDLRYLLAD